MFPIKDINNKLPILHHDIDYIEVAMRKGVSCLGKMIFGVETEDDKVPVIRAPCAPAHDVQGLFRSTPGITFAIWSVSSQKANPEHVQTMINNYD